MFDFNLLDAIMCTKGTERFMENIQWDEAKNRKLLQERGISFESIVIAIEAGKLLDIITHPSVQY